MSLVRHAPGNAHQPLRAAPPRAMDPVRPAAVHSSASTVVAGPLDCAVVIPCHNYGRYLAECLDSVLAQTRRPAEIHVLDDASADLTPVVAQHYAAQGVRYHRVEFRNLHRVRGHGCSLTRRKYVLFLDTDNTIPPAYLQAAVEQLEADRGLAFVYPTLQQFGQRIGPAFEPPEEVTADDIATANRCDAGSVIRRELLAQSLTFRREIPRKVSEDWRMFRDVLGSGPWRAALNSEPLNYRVHAAQCTQTTWRGRTYIEDAALDQEVVTVVVTVSGRWALWPRRLAGLRDLTWPRDRLRVLVVNTTHQPQTLAGLALADFRCAGLALYDHPVGRPGLADLDRRVSEDLRWDVDAAVAAIYNRATLEAGAEFLAILEDDVFPARPDWIEQLMQSMGPRTAAVSGKYHHRYQPDKAVAFRVTEPTSCGLLPLTVSGRQRVDGTGFGALLIRRSVLRQFPLAADQRSHPHYDVDLARRLKGAGWEWWLDADVDCDHLCGSVPQRE